MTDIFQTEPYYVYSGSHTDFVCYGEPLTTDPGLSRQAIISRAARFEHITSSIILRNFAQKNMLYSERLQYYSGSYGGSRTQNLFVQIPDKEQIYDTFLPSPLDIVKTNNVKLMFATGTIGTLEASDLFGLPSSQNDIPVVFGTADTIPASLQNITSGIDTEWMHSRFPFKSKYKNLTRILQPSYHLPSPQNIEKDFLNGDTISPVSKSNLLGTLYYTNETNLISSNPFLYTAGATNPPEFSLINFPINNTATAFYGSDAHNFVQAFVTSFGFQILVGSSGTIAARREDRPTFSEVRGGNYSYNLYDVAHSRGPIVLFSQQFGAWVTVGSSGTILWSSRGDEGNWTATTASSGYTGTFYGVANAQYGGSGQSGGFVAVGTNGEVQYSTNYNGQTWIQSGSLGAFTLRGIDWIDATERFVICGDNGRVYTAGNVSGTNGWTLRTGTTTDTLHAVKVNWATGTILTVGEHAAISRSTDNGATWTGVTNAKAGSYTGTFRGISRCDGSNEIDWVIVGESGEIQYSTDDGITWLTALENPINNNSFYFVADQVVWPDPFRSYENSTPLVIGGQDSMILKEGSFARLVDVEISGTTVGTGKFDGLNINNAALMVTGGISLPEGSTVTRSTYVDLLKAFYGTGPGFEIDFSTANLVSPTSIVKYLHNRSVNYKDFKIVTNADQIETVRLVGPMARGFGYGIANVSPQPLKTIWRRDHFGHFRDMLEQRAYTKIFIPSGEGSSQNTLTSPISINFVSGSTAFIRAKDYVTATNPDYNLHDSGIYDYEYKSGQPFFDDHVGLDY